MDEFKGNILIFVDGYSVEEWRCLDHNAADDAFFGEAGWAVGDNPRDRYCARTSHDKIRRFTDYDEVVRYVHQKQRKFPKQRFQLIYELGNKWTEVSLLDDILDIDASLGKEAAATELIRKEWRDRELPSLDLLLERYGYKDAPRLSALLHVIQTCGVIEAKNIYSRATYYRLSKMLKVAGLID